jgi:hypothetical protein
MPTVTAFRVRMGAVALGAAAILLFVFPLVRPFFPVPGEGTSAETLMGTARDMHSVSWVASHMIAGVGFLLLVPGLIAVYAALSRHRVERGAFTAIWLVLTGVPPILVVLGAETFGLYSIGGAYLAGESADLVVALERVRNSLEFITLSLGLILLAAAAVTLAVAIWGSATLPRWAAAVFAAGLVLWLPFLPEAFRIVDGVFIGLGGCWLAIALWRSADRPVARASA